MFDWFKSKACGGTIYIHNPLNADVADDHMKRIKKLEERMEYAEATTKMEVQYLRDYIPFIALLPVFRAYFTKDRLCLQEGDTKIYLPPNCVDALRDFLNQEAPKER